MFDIVASTVAGVAIDVSTETMMPSVTAFVESSMHSANPVPRANARLLNDVVLGVIDLLRGMMIGIIFVVVGGGGGGGTSCSGG
jgi:hypothetical protein